MGNSVYADLVAFAEGSTRSPGKCLGFANNDVVGHFGHLGELPYSAKTAADQLADHGQLHTDACPNTPHVDFYDFVSGGVNLGHVDWHFPQHGVHVADSSRTTVKLNATGTVGTYANWGARRGWALVPALNAQIAFDNDPGAQPSNDTPAVSGDVNHRIQTALAARGRYQGPIDGAFGPNTWRGIQYTVSHKNGNTYQGAIDGVPGINTYRAMQAYAKKFGGYTGPIDGKLGPNSWEGFAKGLEKGL